jgi:hypothetical protein
MALTKVSGDVIQSTINIGVATATSVNVGSAVTINSSGITVVGVVTASRNVIGELTVNSGAYVSGNLGVGTINPTSTVDIFGLQANTGSLSANPPSGTLRLAYDGASNPGNYGSSLVFSQRYFSGQKDQIAVGQISGIKLGGDGGFGGGLTFFTSNGSGNDLAERLRIDSSGNIGIGTVSPGAKLSVYGSGGTSISLNNSFTGTSASSGFQLQTGSGGDAYIWNYSNSFIALATNNTERARIDSSGKLLVGTTNTYPSSTTNTIGIFNGTILTGSTNGFTTSTSGGNDTAIICGGDIEIARDGVSGTQRHARIRGVGDSLGGPYSSGIAFDYYNYNGASYVYNEGFRIDSTGNVITPNNIGAGLNIGYKKIVTLSGTYAANTWYNTGIDRTTDTGIYLLNAWVDTYGSGGQSYQETYIGWFVLPNRASNNTTADTITTHRAGHAPGGEAIQFRTLRTLGASDSKIYLQWLSNFAYTTALNGTAGRNIQISIHRFATALNNG